MGTYDDPDLPVEATRSVEADIVFFNDPQEDKADAVDGAIGEESAFHQTHGYYGQGVSMTTAVLPTGWMDRLVFFDREDAEPATARCLEIYDISAAKLVAGREKDFAYVEALINAGLIESGTLRERCALIPGPEAVRSRILKWVDRNHG